MLPRELPEGVPADQTQACGNHSFYWAPHSRRELQTQSLACSACDSHARTGMSRSYSAPGPSCVAAGRTRTLAPCQATTDDEVANTGDELAPTDDEVSTLTNDHVSTRIDDQMPAPPTTRFQPPRATKFEHTDLRLARFDFGLHVLDARVLQCQGQMAEGGDCGGVVSSPSGLQ